MKATIMRAANTVIEGLLYGVGVGDPDFTDDVLDHIVGGMPFEAEDITSTENEED